MIFFRISALASKTRSNQKSSETQNKILQLGVKDAFIFFLFDLFLEARAEILEIFLLVLWKIWRHQKDILKLTYL